MRLFIGIIIFSIVTITVFLLLSQSTDWPMEVIVIFSLLLGGVTEWLFYKLRQSDH
ncbi:hypothetical protein ACM26V_09975 [Salipaludibacillus sp. HK11]|uniref:hypothetical protein n=1 Tax=Salipaludibacillus sp. HK11 TaxID=3394320 RepID=UPI0039FC2BC6